MENIREWLIAKIAEEAEVDKGTVDCHMDFEDFDLDSLALVSLSYDLESFLNKEISPTVFSEYNTIDKLTTWLESQK
ncbi:MAG: acyl carrier protein [Reichenbachiella sp.]|uniref:acyl carrier protein n=1 Tax=Reichenbachiella sp. TaxID=2184521 RepID=UPI0029673FB2|nr:acyl carrier protein [Reichenbachiella sp.]MDW3209677.1 acyl carrier protein [Reichenbachiella sp.]